MPNYKISLWSKMKRYWDKDRKFNLLVISVWLYTLLIFGIWNNTSNYYAIVLGIFFLILDNHNMEDKNAQK